MITSGIKKVDSFPKELLFAWQIHILIVQISYSVVVLDVGWFSEQNFSWF